MTNLELEIVGGWALETDDAVVIGLIVEASPVRPAPHAYLMANEILNVSQMSPADRYQWVQDHPDWREYMAAYQMVYEYEIGPMTPDPADQGAAQDRVMTTGEVGRVAVETLQWLADS